MKLDKTLILSVVAIGLLASGSVFGQNSTNLPAASGTNTPPHRPPLMLRGPSLEGLARYLNLTDAQKAQVQPIILAEQQKMRDVRQDSSLTLDEKRAKMEEIRDGTTAQLQSILTPEQFARWQHLTQPRRRPMPMPAPAGEATNAPPGSAP